MIKISARLGRGAVLGLILGLTACASEPAKSQIPQPTNSAPPPRSEAPAAEPASADMCGAAKAQAYVGRPRSAIPVAVEPALQRVACTTCPVTLDFVPRRLNFFYDAETGIVKEVRCG